MKEIGSEPKQQVPASKELASSIGSKAIVLMVSVGVVMLLALVVKFYQPLDGSSPELPDFASIADVKLKKQAFFDYLQPIIVQVNNEVLLARAEVLRLKQKSLLNERERAYLLTLAKHYNVEDLLEVNDAFFHALLARVDKVPVALALAQAANESAWGTSRFALEANNLFGQWCFTKGCGIVPKSRDEDKIHEVASFKSIPKAVRAYVKNVNSSSAYPLFRALRSDMRKGSELLASNILVEGLSKYSLRGDEYINEIRAIIRINKLEQYDVSE